MTFYKLIKTQQYKNNMIEHYIQYGRDNVHVRIMGNDYVICETGEVLRPIYDSRTSALAGFIDG